MNRIDKKLLKLGFVKKEENKYVVTFERFEKNFGFVHKVDIIQKQSKKHLIFSYVKNGINRDCVVGLTYVETKLFMKKFRQMKRKYKWSDEDE